VVAQVKSDLEARGEYVVLANIDSGWFAMYPSTWSTRIADANRYGREGPNLVVYRTKSDDPRDHYVIPFSVVRSLLVDETITHSKNGSKRWNLGIKDGRLHVTHGEGKVDVERYFRLPLLVEGADIILPQEVEPFHNQIFREGAIRQIQVNAYERDRRARDTCVTHFGRRCVICRMAFGEVYGPDAASIIHVHHLVSLSELKGEYTVDPIKDLRPVCPNCHAVIHSRTPIYTIEEVEELFAAASHGQHRTATVCDSES
jgi:hypothetical protein